MTGRTLAITCVQLQRTIEDHRARLEDEGVQVLLPDVAGQQLSEAEMMAVVPGVDGLIVGDDAITRVVLERGDRLRVVSKWGIGIDNIDLAAAAELGIRVTNTPGVFDDEVADVVIGYLMLLARQLHSVDDAVRDGQWLKPVGVSLAGRTMGIVGLGHIGRAVARRAMALKMRVIGSEVIPEQASAAGAEGVDLVDLPTLLQQADVVSLNCPLTPDNWHMIDAVALAGMKAGGFLINTARGPLVDEAALAAAASRGDLAGAALDVFEVEPLPADSPLRDLRNVILGSHNASNTAEAVQRTSTLAIDNVLAGLRGAGV